MITKKLTPYRQVCSTIAKERGVQDCLRFVMQKSYGEIEKKCNARDDIFKTAYYIAKELDLDDALLNELQVRCIGERKVYMTEADKVFFDTLKDLIKFRMSQDSPEGIYGIERFAFQCAARVHSEWVEEIIKKNPNIEGADIMKILPLELQEYEVVKQRLKYVQPILKSLGLNCTEYRMRFVCDENKKRFEEGHLWRIGNKYNTDKIANDLRKGPKFYSALKNGGYPKSKKQAQEFAQTYVFSKSKVHTNF